MADHSKDYYIKYNVSPMFVRATCDEVYSGDDSSSDMSDKGSCHEYQCCKPNKRLHADNRGSSSSSGSPEMEEKWSETEMSTLGPLCEPDTSQCNAKPDIADGVQFSLLNSIATSSFSKKDCRMEQSPYFAATKSSEKMPSAMDKATPPLNDAKSKSFILQDIINRNPQMTSPKPSMQDASHSVIAIETSLFGRSTEHAPALDKNQNATSSSSIPSRKVNCENVSSTRDERCSVSQSKSNTPEVVNKAGTSPQRQEQSMLELMKMRRQKKLQNKHRNITIIEKTSANSEKDIDALVQQILNVSPPPSSKQKNSKQKQKQKSKNGKTCPRPERASSNGADITKKSKSSSIESKPAQDPKVNCKKEEEFPVTPESKVAEQASSHLHSSNFSPTSEKSNDTISSPPKVESEAASPVSSISNPLSKAVADGFVAFTDFESLNSSQEDSFQVVTSRKEKSRKMAARSNNGQQSTVQAPNSKPSHLVNNASKRFPFTSASGSGASDKVPHFQAKGDLSRRFPPPHSVSGLPVNPRLSSNDSNISRPPLSASNWPPVSQSCNNSVLNHPRTAAKPPAVTTPAPNNSNHTSSSALPLRSSSTSAAPVCHGERIPSTASMTRRGSAVSKNDDVFYDSCNSPLSNSLSHSTDASKAPSHPQSYSSKSTAQPVLNNGVNKNVVHSRTSSSQISARPLSTVPNACRMEEKKLLSQVSQPNNQPHLDYLVEKWQLFLHEFDGVRHRQPDLVGTF